jgi:hypothetical protein
MAMTSVRGDVDTGRGLDLDPQQLAVDIGDQVVIRAVAERQTDRRADPGEPFDRGGLTQVALLAPVDQPL